jgi:hypothetical protein
VSGAKRRRRITLAPPHAIIDQAAIIPATPVAEVMTFLARDRDVAGWFGCTLLNGRRVTLGESCRDMIVGQLTTERQDRGRFVAFDGITSEGPVSGSISLRAIVCKDASRDGLVPGTEVWAHVELPPLPTSMQLAIDGLVRRGLRHMRSELGS